MLSNPKTVPIHHDNFIWNDNDILARKANVWIKLCNKKGKHFFITGCSSPTNVPFYMDYFYSKCFGIGKHMLRAKHFVHNWECFKYIKFYFCMQVISYFLFVIYFLEMSIDTEILRRNYQNQFYYYMAPCFWVMTPVKARVQTWQ